METIFSNCDGCNNMDALTEYENELLCERCLKEELDSEEWDEDGFFNDSEF